MTDNVSRSSYSGRRYTEIDPVQAPNPSAPDYTGKLDNINGYSFFKPNCYSYAVQSPQRTHPGRSLGDAYNALPGTSLDSAYGESAFDTKARRSIMGAKIDGAKFLGDKPRHTPGNYLIAAMQLPSTEYCKADDDDGCSADYHFVRQDSDGRWSHKPGDFNPTRLDSSGKPIIDPRKADIRFKGRPYTFIGFFEVPKGGLIPNGEYAAGTGLAKLKPLDDAAKLPIGQLKVARLNSRNAPDAPIYLRQDEKGKWWRQDDPSPRDDQGKPVLDPRTAKFKDYKGEPYEFSGYLSMPGTLPDEQEKTSALSKKTPSKSGTKTKSGRVLN